MRIDIVTIFPAFFDVLDVSLIGKAREKGLLDLRVHDLRDWTHDRHRTVDDTPYGGGAGMVMKPEPWGEALDEILGVDGVLVVPTPSGEVFRQPLARELAREPQLVFACGRYEGIDQRVIDHYASRGRVRLVSIGDYVLNGGEVASMAMIEAVTRLIPGFMGNPESLLEESHEDGLLESTREAIADQLRGWLVRLSATDPRRLSEFLSVHHLGVKALALHDVEMLRLVEQWWPMETNRGRSTLAEFRAPHGVERSAVGPRRLLGGGQLPPPVQTGYQLGRIGESHASEGTARGPAPRERRLTRRTPRPRRTAPGAPA